MDQWLVRTAKNLIAGPYSRDELKALILGRKVGHEDEVCPSNGYWFYLHEREEVARQLALEVPEPLPSASEDVTETQTENVLEKTDPLIDRKKLWRDAKSSSYSNEEGDSELESTHGSLKVSKPSRVAIWNLLWLILIGMGVALYTAYRFFARTV